MDTAAKIVTEVERLWSTECLTIPVAFQRACDAIPASPAAVDRARRLVHPAVARLRARREAAILALAERLGGGPDLAVEIDAWVEAQRLIKRARASGRSPSDLRVAYSVLLDLEAKISARLRPDVWREFSTGFEV